MKTVHELAAFAGVSVRTLHHYDAVGLLKPTAVTAAGYRLYDDEAAKRLETILLFRELRFPLKEIASLVNDPSFDRTEALRDQLRLLEAERRRLDGIISLCREEIETGGTTMKLSAFEHAETERLKAEVKEKWGNTAAWRESEAHSDEENAKSGEDLMDLFAEFGKLKTLSPASTEAQAMVKRLKDFITAHYYTCTDEILAGLGEMYVSDERFRLNIDKAGGPGAAAFAAEAIRTFVKR